MVGLSPQTLGATQCVYSMDKVPLYAYLNVSVMHYYHDYSGQTAVHSIPNCQILAFS